MLIESYKREYDGSDLIWDSETGLFTNLLPKQEMHGATYSGKEFILVENTRLVWDRDAIVASVSIIEMDESEDTVFIFTDYLFRLGSKNFKTFVLLHEMGHYFKKHSKLPIDLKEKHKLMIEHEADLYAVKNIGLDNSIEAMKELRTLVTSMMPNFDTTKLDSRINMLESKRVAK